MRVYSDNRWLVINNMTYPSKSIDGKWVKYSISLRSGDLCFLCVRRSAIKKAMKRIKGDIRRMAK